MPSVAVYERVIFGMLLVVALEAPQRSHQKVGTGHVYHGP
jgi:hypothetical protein